MCAVRIIRSALADVLEQLHVARVRALLAVLEALLAGARLSLTGLGRSVPGPVAPRHCIKRVDRLLSNPHLHAELPLLYGGLARHLLDATPQPVVLVDWTDVGSGREALVAALAVDGRALTVYAEVHPARLENDARVHKAFLETLAKHVIPATARPVIVTDAGFRNPWFRAVQDLGWDFIGRACKNVRTFDVRLGPAASFNSANWASIGALHVDATPTPKHLGTHHIAMTSPLEVNLVALRKYSKGRRGQSHANRRGVHPNSSAYKKYQRRAREPWLLATSLDAPAATVAGIYGERMKIEETFRDAKSHRFGWSFEDARCRKLATPDGRFPAAHDRAGSKRLEVLLLLAALGMLAAHTLGKAAERAKLNRRYQANTTTSRRVLSLFFLGCQVLNDTHPPKFTRAALQAATNALRRAIETAREPTPERLRAICGDP